VVKQSHRQNKAVDSPSFRITSQKFYRAFRFEAFDTTID